MKTLLITLLIVAGGAAYGLAATLEWNYHIGTDNWPTNYYIDQVWADGKGGCVAIFSMDNDDTWTTIRSTVIRFDKKGAIAWSNTYARAICEFGYVDRKTAVYTVTSEAAGDQAVHVVDKKAVETVTSEADTDISCSFNSEMGPLGDKKGFFVERDDAPDNSVQLRRYSYK